MADINAPLMALKASNRLLIVASLLLHVFLWTLIGIGEGHGWDTGQAPFRNAAITCGIGLVAVVLVTIGSAEDTSEATAYAAALRAIAVHLTADVNPVLMRDYGMACAVHGDMEALVAHGRHAALNLREAQATFALVLTVYAHDPSAVGGAAATLSAHSSVVGSTTATPRRASAAEAAEVVVVDGGVELSARSRTSSTATAAGRNATTVVVALAPLALDGVPPPLAPHLLALAAATTAPAAAAAVAALHTALLLPSPLLAAAAADVVASVRACILEAGNRARDAVGTPAWSTAVAHQYGTLLATLPRPLPPAHL